MLQWMTCMLFLSTWPATWSYDTELSGGQPAAAAVQQEGPQKISEADHLSIPSNTGSAIPELRKINNPQVNGSAFVDETQNLTVQEVGRQKRCHEETDRNLQSKSAKLEKIAQRRARMEKNIQKGVKHLNSIEDVVQDRWLNNWAEKEYKYYDDDQLNPKYFHSAEKNANLKDTANNADSADSVTPRTLVRRTRTTNLPRSGDAVKLPFLANTNEQPVQQAAHSLASPYRRFETLREYLRFVHDQHKQNQESIQSKLTSPHFNLQSRSPGLPPQHYDYSRHNGNYAYGTSHWVSHPYAADAAGAQPVKDRIFNTDSVGNTNANLKYQTEPAENHDDATYGNNPKWHYSYGSKKPIQIENSQTPQENESHDDLRRVSSYDEFGREVIYDPTASRHFNYPQLPGYYNRNQTIFNSDASTNGGVLSTNNQGYSEQYDKSQQQKQNTLHDSERKYAPSLMQTPHAKSAVELSAYHPAGSNKHGIENVQKMYNLTAFTNRDVQNFQETTNKFTSPGEIDRIAYYPLAQNREQIGQLSRHEPRFGINSLPGNSQTISKYDQNHIETPQELSQLNGEQAQDTEVSGQRDIHHIDTSQRDYQLKGQSQKVINATKLISDIHEYHGGFQSEGHENAAHVQNSYSNRIAYKLENNPRNDETPMTQAKNPHKSSQAMGSIPYYQENSHDQHGIAIEQERKIQASDQYRKEAQHTNSEITGQAEVQINGQNGKNEDVPHEPLARIETQHRSQGKPQEVQEQIYQENSRLLQEDQMIHGQHQHGNINSKRQKQMTYAEYEPADELQKGHVRDGHGTLDSHSSQKEVLTSGHRQIGDYMGSFKNRKSEIHVDDALIPQENGHVNFQEGAKSLREPAENFIHISYPQISHTEERTLQAGQTQQIKEHFSIPQEGSQTNNKNIEETQISQQQRLPEPISSNGNIKIDAFSHLLPEDIASTYSTAAQLEKTAENQDRKTAHASNQKSDEIFEANSPFETMDKFTPHSYSQINQAKEQNPQIGQNQQMKDHFIMPHAGSKTNNKNIEETQISQQQRLPKPISSNGNIKIDAFSHLLPEDIASTYRTEAQPENTAENQDRKTAHASNQKSDEIFEANSPFETMDKFTPYSYSQISQAKEQNPQIGQNQQMKDHFIMPHAGSKANNKNIEETQISQQQRLPEPISSNGNIKIDAFSHLLPEDIASTYSTAAQLENTAENQDRKTAHASNQKSDKIFEANSPFETMDKFTPYSYSQISQAKEQNLQFGQNQQMKDHFIMPHAGSKTNNKNIEETQISQQQRLPEPISSNGNIKIDAFSHLPHRENDSTHRTVAQLERIAKNQDEKIAHASNHKSDETVQAQWNGPQIQTYNISQPYDSRHSEGPDDNEEKYFVKAHHALITGSPKNQSCIGKTSIASSHPVDIQAANEPLVYSKTNEQHDIINKKGDLNSNKHQKIILQEDISPKTLSQEASRSRAEHSSESPFGYETRRTDKSFSNKFLDESKQREHPERHRPTTNQENEPKHRLAEHFSPVASVLAQTQKTPKDTLSDSNYYDTPNVNRIMHGIANVENEQTQNQYYEKASKDNSEIVLTHYNAEDKHYKNKLESHVNQNKKILVNHEIGTNSKISEFNNDEPQQMPVQILKEISTGPEEMYQSSPMHYKEYEYENTPAMSRNHKMDSINKRLKVRPLNRSLDGITKHPKKKANEEMYHLSIDGEPNETSRHRQRGKWHRINPKKIDNAERNENEERNPISFLKKRYNTKSPYHVVVENESQEKIAAPTTTESPEYRIIQDIEKSSEYHLDHLKENVKVLNSLMNNSRGPVVTSKLPNFNFGIKLTGNKNSKENKAKTLNYGQWDRKHIISPVQSQNISSSSRSLDTETKPNSEILKQLIGTANTKDYNFEDFDNDDLAKSAPNIYDDDSADDDSYEDDGQDNGKDENEVNPYNNFSLLNKKIPKQRLKSTHGKLSLALQKLQEERDSKLQEKLSEFRKRIKEKANAKSTTKVIAQKSKTNTNDMKNEEQSIKRLAMNREEAEQKNIPTHFSSTDENLALSLPDAAPSNAMSSQSHIEKLDEKEKDSIKEFSNTQAHKLNPEELSASDTVASKNVQNAKLINLINQEVGLPQKRDEIIPEDLKNAKESSPSLNTETSIPRRVAINHKLEKTDFTNHTEKRSCSCSSQEKERSMGYFPAENQLGHYLTSTQNEDEGQLGLGDLKSRIEAARRGRIDTADRNQHLKNVPIKSDSFETNGIQSTKNNEIIEMKQPHVCGCGANKQTSYEEEFNLGIRNSKPAHSCNCGKEHESCSDSEYLKEAHRQPELNKYDIMHMLLWLKHYVPKENLR